MPIHDIQSENPSPTEVKDIQSLRKIRVLVLDDEAPVRRFIRSALESAGCVVETADDGRTGLQVLLQHDFDVLLVDIRMTEMNGLAFIQEAQKIWPWLGIIIITGYADEDIYRQAKQLGVRHVLEKPVQVAVLKETVLLEHDQARQSSEPAQEPLIQVQSQLGLLRKLGEMAAQGESLLQALRNLARGIGRLLPCAAVGLFDRSGEDDVVIVYVRDPLEQTAVAEIQEEMIQRFEALSGSAVDRGRLRVEVENPKQTTQTEKQTLSVATVPILSEGEVHGILSLASTQGKAYSKADIAFLYHAASHFSTALVALSRMKNLAARDALTSLYNRRQLEEEMKLAWNLADRHGHAMSIVIIDIDRYKDFNDNFGHLTGDQILREFAALLVEVARSSDVLGRYGGDEFFVILPQTNLQEAMVFCSRLMRAVRRHEFCAPDQPMQITLSIGLTNTYSDPSPHSLEEFISRADQALYFSKRTGRDRCSVWNAKLPMQTQENRKEPLAEEPSTKDQDISSRRIMVVDDDPAIGRLIQRYLSETQFQIDVYQTAHEAIDQIRSHPSAYDVLLIDLNLSEESGLDILDQVRTDDPSVVMIVISGEATLDNAVASLRFGAYDFIAKPINRTDLSATLERALEVRRLTLENQRYQVHLEEMVRKKSKALLNTMSQLKISYQFTLAGMIHLLDIRENSASHHSQRVQRMAIIMGEELGLSEEELETISRGALLHDIGKIAIPDSILLKAGPLTNEEWVIMRRHAEIGYTVIKGNPDLQDVSEIVYTHHERFDGTGYPRGLAGAEIPLGSRIFAIVDAYDAMRSERIYRKSIPAHEVVEEIKRCSGTHFDPEIVNAFLRCQPRLEEIGGWEETNRTDGIPQEPPAQKRTTV